MRRSLVTCLILAFDVLIVTSAISSAQEPAPPLPGAGLTVNDPGTEVMMRGPVHEAFAEPVNASVTPPPLVTGRPPDPIEEIPPDAKPDDENVVWIGGYWAWDDESNDFLWVSGVWRVPPMGQQWVPGYWSEVAGGYRWVPGLWTPAGTEQVVYYPQPPESLEQGPVGDSPTADSIWTPGGWQWRDGRYVWQPGYWGLGHQGLVWTPASYFWSPNGWVHSDGYWDYPLTERGVLFAPIRFTTAVYRQPSYRLIPSVVVAPEALHFHLFVRPAHHHYYFGDYYAPTYERLGYYPWFEAHRHRPHYYDPFYWYSHWYYRDRNPRWIDQWRQWHHHYRDHADWRPPHNFAALRERMARGDDRPDRQLLAMAATVQDLRRDPKAFVRFTPLSAEQRETVDRGAQESRHFRRQRAELETRAIAGPAGTAGPSSRATELKAPRQLALPRLPALELPQRGTPRTAARPISPPDTAHDRGPDRGQPMNRGDSPRNLTPGRDTSPIPDPETSPLPGIPRLDGGRPGPRSGSPPDTTPRPRREPLPGSPGYNPGGPQRGGDLRSGTTSGLGTSSSRGIPGIDAGRPGSGTNLPSGVVPRIGEPRTPPMPGARTPQAAQSPPPSTPFPGALMPRGTPSNTDLLPRSGQESPLVPRTIPQTRIVPENRPGGASLAPPSAGRGPRIGAAPRDVPPIPRLGRRPEYTPGGPRLEPPRQATPKSPSGPSREPPGGGRTEPDQNRERPERK